MAGGRLDGRVVLVVGGGTDGPPRAGEDLPIGNGRAIAVLCAREGARVVVADLRADLAEETADLIRREGGSASAVAMDATDLDDCRRTVDVAVSTFGGLHGMVNVLGVVNPQSINDVDVDDFDRCYRVNVRSNLLTMKFAAPEMAKSGGGAIVNLSSVAALRSGAGIGYETTKAAQIALSRSAAVTLAAQNIRVNTVLLGTIDTPVLRRHPGALEMLTPRIPLGRAGTPWEAASAVVFLLSDDAAFISGTQLVIDGADTATR
jgi:NAD(P)-dependent dehydrogenase (short-subunit alcohol dehydrogenase family)